MKLFSYIILCSSIVFSSLISVHAKTKTPPISLEEQSRETYTIANVLLEQIIRDIPKSVFENATIFIAPVRTEGKTTTDSVFSQHFTKVLYQTFTKKGIHVAQWEQKNSILAEQKQKAEQDMKMRRLFEEEKDKKVLKAQAVLRKAEAMKETSAKEVKAVTAMEYEANRNTIEAKSLLETAEKALEYQQQKIADAQVIITKEEKRSIEFAKEISILEEKINQNKKTNGTASELNQLQKDKEGKHIEFTKNKELLTSVRTTKNTLEKELKSIQVSEREAKQRLDAVLIVRNTARDKLEKAQVLLGEASMRVEDITGVLGEIQKKILPPIKGSYELQVTYSYANGMLIVSGSVIALPQATTIKVVQHTVTPSLYIQTLLQQKTIYEKDILVRSLSGMEEVGIIGNNNSFERGIH